MPEVDSIDPAKGVYVTGVESIDSMKGVIDCMKEVIDSMKDVERLLSYSLINFFYRLYERS